MAMAALRALNLRESGITDLAGLEYAVNLEALDLGRNPVADLSVLALLPRLATLNVDGMVGDPWPLAALIGPRRLSARQRADRHRAAGRPGEPAPPSLRGNGVSELWPLAGFTGLEVLDMRDNAVRDWTPVYGLWNLRRLGSGGNARADTDPILNTLDTHGILQD